MRTCLIAVALASLAAAAPLEKRWAYSKYWNVEGHRGARGEAIESTLPAFAQALVSGVTTLEFDFGVTRDNKVVVWHDETIQPEKCFDTAPAFENDPDFPYVNKSMNDLTLAQVKTLDCGSQRLTGFPLAFTVPGQKLSTLDELFDFVDCATDEPVLFNIESKINPEVEGATKTPAEFMDVFLPILQARGDDVIDRVTHQSFDWRSIILSKERLPSLRTSALCDDTTIYAYPEGETTGNLTVHGEGAGKWLAGINIDDFEGETIGERVARAAASIKADVLSPVATSYASPVASADLEGWIPFVNSTMVDTAHELGIKTHVWTPNTAAIWEYLLDIGVDGFITDYPENARRFCKAQYPELPLAPKADELRVQKCLIKHNQVHDISA
ncbi:uncharacterized protein JCM10292_007180 [Rhodotorula paludigena]|uniref:uncharacterized protein n=1 Tax=Rhodotorula paludigena TaxID=86838 RepID=UPI00317981B0